MSDGVASSSWQITDEFAVRLGCGLTTALIFPLWLALMFVAIGGGLSDIGIWLLLALLIASLVGGVMAWFRIRSVPRRITLSDGHLEIERPSGVSSVAVADIRTVHVGQRGRLRPVSLDLNGGRTLRMSRDLDDFDGFLAALLATNDDVQVISDGEDAPDDVADKRGGL